MKNSHFVKIDVFFCRNEDHPVSRTLSQHYSSSRYKDRSFHIDREMLSRAAIFEQDKSHTSPYPNTSGLHGDAELVDFGPVYDSALTTSQLVAASCPNLSAALRGEVGGRVPDQQSLQDTEEYEVMLATGANPAYKHIKHPPTASTRQAEQQIPGIYEHVP